MSALTASLVVGAPTMDQFSFLRTCADKGYATKLFETDTAEQLLAECGMTRLLLVRIRGLHAAESRCFRKHELEELKEFLRENKGKISTCWSLKEECRSTYEACTP